MAQELGVVASLAVETDEQSAGEARRQVEQEVAAPLEVGVEIDESTLRDAQEAAQADIDPDFFDLERKEARLERLESMGERVGGVMETLGKVPTSPGEAMGMATRGAARAGKSALVKGGIIPSPQTTVPSDGSGGGDPESPGATGPSGAGGGMNEVVLEELRTQTQLLDSIEEIFAEEERRDFLSNAQGGGEDDGGAFGAVGVGSIIGKTGGAIGGIGGLLAGGAIGAGGIAGQLFGDQLDMDASNPDDLQGRIRGMFGMDETFTPEADREDSPIERDAEKLRNAIEDAGAPEWITRWFNQGKGQDDGGETLQDRVDRYENEVIDEPTTRRDTQDHRDRGVGITSGDGEVATGPDTPSQTENRAGETAGTRGGPGLVVNNEYTIDPDAIARKLEEQRRDLEKRVKDLESQLQRSGGLVR